jgi:DNA end-binding protein Ku
MRVLGLGTSPMDDGREARASDPTATMRAMARSVWKGTLSFGLVAIPVSLYPATEAKDVRFHLFDREGRRVRYRRVVEAGPSLGQPEESDAESTPPDDHEGPAETEVAYEDLVRGYEVEPESFVFLENEEIERARPSPSRVIDLEHFVRLHEIDPVYFEKSYYVVPAPGAEKAYELLLRALTETGRVGIGRFVLRTKPHLVALRPMEQVLALETLYFGDEVRDAAPLVSGLRGAVTQREVDISKQLVEALETVWDPSRFADEYREELMRMIAERTPKRIEEPIEESSAASGPRMEDLMDALRRSVEEAKAGGKQKGGRRAG